MFSAALWERSPLIVLPARAHSPVSLLSDCKAYFKFTIAQFQYRLCSTVFILTADRFQKTAYNLNDAQGINKVAQVILFMSCQNLDAFVKIYTRHVLYFSGFLIWPIFHSV